MNRRHFNCCGAALAAGLFAGLFTDRSAQATPLRNPCRGPLPRELATHDLLQRAYEGLDTTRLVDTHAHLLGTGDSGSGCSVHPSTQQWWHPVEVLRRQAILNGACVPAGVASVDRAYVERLQTLAADFPAGARWWLYAFEHAHDDRGQARPEWSTFHVPDAYAAAVAAAQPARFDWVASVHPYREDAVQKLDHALASGAVAVKWLPSAMNIDLRDARCRPFYDRLAASGRPLVVHCGEEKAVPGAGRDELGNPLLLRHALQHGVTVIAAHCASLGHATDIDQRRPGSRPAFELFARLMDERGTQGLLLGDISAVFQRNRSPQLWHTVLKRQDWHARLLHGSDHPLPGVMPLFSLPRLCDAGLLAPADAQVLARIREHNPLVFDFALKRCLRSRGVALPAAVFEARALSAAAPRVALGDRLGDRRHTGRIETVSLDPAFDGPPRSGLATTLQIAR